MRGVFAVLGEREGRQTPVTADFSRWTFRRQTAKPPFSAAQKSAFGSAAIFGADRAYFIPVNKISKCFSHNFRLFLTISALFHLLFITLQTQCPRILHTALWQKMWSDSPRWNHYRSWRRGFLFCPSARYKSYKHLSTAVYSSKFTGQ